MTERLSDKNPCKLLKEGCRWRGNCDKRQLWLNKCIEKLKEYETAEEEGRLVVLSNRQNSLSHQRRSGESIEANGKGEMTY